MSQSGYSMSNQFGNPNEGVDPSELSMQNGFMSYPFSSQQNLSSSFNFGNSGIDTDELLDLEINGHNGVQQNYLQDQQSSAGISMSHPGQMSQMYSNTPDGAPMHSPFMHSFNYDHFRSMSQPGQAPHLQGNGSHFDQSYLNAKARPSIQALDRASYDGRSPMTPKTPALGALTLGTPESGSFPTQPIRTGLQHRHQKTLSNQWDGTPGSAHSYVESPISSPGHPSHHAGISEILKSGKHASLPAKVDTHMPGSAQDLESQEAKRRRRRASHNLVERRRRDNINERIQDLSHLVPQHRLEDDKVRKQLVNNTAMSGTGATANAATSLLAGGNGRRATAGNITMGLPIEEKEKGPNKGDILNGAVGWMRDLMWALHVKLQQESELAELISKLGGTWPFEQTEEEKRMRTEILDALEKNDPSSFAYSRAPGSGLRVPKHTNIAGDSVSGNGTLSPQSLSPPFNSGSSSNGGGPGQAQYWNTSGHAGMSFKEEDEYAMEMN
ncbi:putative HLH transcription factor [Aspergillus japonicus CBS 114.51]|uniref:Putative HLH transcription factor n=2 Tax=Aspergillus TaxID=5052 RepID=A0A2V5HQG2_ASPV1|nr:putative HLH transcription factor [Aspergillus japonicus CBS 114.51]PYI18510.1 putative HLH transcription factor [Aspergillus violaceofuscus CBS 115571]RAH81456.1 putative HLH transcription factor [Aspergillus japonicus CBS 114.51]